MINLVLAVAIVTGGMAWGTLVASRYRAQKSLEQSMPSVEPFGAFANGSLPKDFLPATPNSDWTVRKAYSHLEFDAPIAAEPLPGSEVVWVAERKGRIWAFQDRHDAREKSLVLDLQETTWDGTDSGLLSFAFDPDFEVGNRRVFVARTTLGHSPSRLRLSFFQVDLEGKAAIDSETVLIDQASPKDQHRGGAIVFGADRMLYFSVGDQGYRARSQRVDRTLMGGVLRLDVHSANPPAVTELAPGLWGGNYHIPADNPNWADDRALREYFAIGLRNPHRLTAHAESGAVFAADVGGNVESSREEINRIESGANFGWPFSEGDDESEARPAEMLGNFKLPVFDYDHDGGDRCIIGGPVFLGDSFLTADYSSGRIWSQPISEEGELSDERSLLGRLSGIVSFGRSARGEILLCSGKNKNLYRLRAKGASAEEPLPMKLSETGLFSQISAKTLTPIDALIPYAVNSPLFSDGAVKSRWIAVPTDGKRNLARESISLSTNSDGSEEWDLPVGSVLVKHFEMAMDESRRHVRRRLETRLMVRGERGYYGATYRWNDEQTDARLIVEDVSEDYQVVSADGIAREQTWTYPGMNSCTTCHTEKAGSVLGLKLHQLSRAAPDELSGNQLMDWIGEGLLTGIEETEVAQIAKAAPVKDREASHDLRLRSWLDVNCSHCHLNDGSNRTQFDFRFTSTGGNPNWFLELANLHGSDSGGTMIDLAHPNESLLLQRIVETDKGAMPPLGRHTVDWQAIDLLTEVIKKPDLGSNPVYVSVKP